MGTEEGVTTSSAVLTVAAARLHRSLNAVSDAVGVSVPVNADILDIGYSSPRPLVARAGATAVAEAYMKYRARTTNDSSSDRLAAPGVQTRLVTPAARPAAPSSPDVVVDLLAGIVVGLVAGLALAFAVDRFGRRIRTMARWGEITGVPVVVGLQTGATVDVFASQDGNVGVLRYLRVRVGRALPSHAAVLLVAQVGEQPEAAAIARDLAGAFVDIGRQAVVIEVTRDLGSSAGGEPSASADDLRVRVTPPARVAKGPGTAGDWRPSTVSHLLGLVERHRADSGLVIVSAPPTSVSVAALDLAAIADAALLVDNCVSSRRIEATRAVTEMRGAGCAVCGCVLLGLRTTRLGNAVRADMTPPRNVPAPRLRPRPGDHTEPKSFLPSASLAAATPAVLTPANSVNGREK
jgi:hypothetical protein